MKIELSDNYAQAVVRSLKDREKGLVKDLQYYKGRDTGDAIEKELLAVRAVKEHIEEQLLKR